MASGSSKALTARVRMDTKDAMRSLNLLEKKINAINKAVNKNATVFNNVGAAVNRATKATNNLNTAANKTANSADKINKNFKKSGTTVDWLTKKVRALAATYLGIMGAKAVIKTSDIITSAENKLNNLPEGSQVSTQMSMDKMYAASQKARTGYTDMISNVSKSMTLAGSSFQDNIDNAIRFQEIMAKAYTLGGASAAEQSSSMYQMIQALGSGILQGDELRSVREGAPIAYKEIEKFAQGVFNTEESLKELASQGMITSDLVVAAIMKAGDGIDGIDAKFEQTKMTFAQAFTQMKNVAIKSFEPVLQMLNEALRSDFVQHIMNSISQAIQFVAAVFVKLFQIIGAVYNFIAERWAVISKIIITAGIIYAGVMSAIFIGKAIAWLATIGSVTTALQVNLMWQWLLTKQSLYQTATAIAGWLAQYWAVALIIGIIVALILIVVWLADSFVDACGIIVGSIMTAVAFVWNVVIGVINSIIHALWLQFVEPWIGIIEWVLNVFNGGFNSFGDGVKNLLGNIISWFLSLGQVVTKIIDAIFGTNWTGGLEALKGKLTSWGKNDKAITLNKEAPTIGNRWAYGDAYNKGYEWGSSAGQWLSDKFNFNNLPSGSDYDVNGAYTIPTDLTNGVGDTADNTGKMAKSMELTAEDLEYLRRVADMEWKKEFTTATIQVDMSNYNTVNGDSDLDGIVTKLTNKLYEELATVADGVYV